MNYHARMKLTKAIADGAEQTIELTMEEAAKLPGFLGRFVTARFRHFGFYTCTLDGVKTLYVMKKEAN